MRKIVPAGLILVAVATLAIFLYRGQREPSPDTIESKPRPAAEKPESAKPPAPPPDAPEPAPTRADPATGLPQLKPGEVIPGTRPDTIIVQPMQPGPPKEIMRHYTVPTTEEDPRVDRTKDGKLLFHQPIAMARELHNLDHDPEEDVQILDGIISYYKLMYRQNPVGENFEVMRALMGENEHQMVVFPADHPSLGPNGELLDRWGNPYFFHSLSSTEMNVQSAGPDGKLGTIDDYSLGLELEDGKLAK